LFGAYLLTYWRVYVVVIFCRVYAVFSSYSYLFWIRYVAWHMHYTDFLVQFLYCTHYSL